ncbi:snoRNA-binding rRNA-processing protein ENP1 [Ascoidea rubescens DSM 1968]|uniref:Putative nucleolar snoRNA-binding protein n=1 Tax=Ascoidea rubescens DSM 1968 TaxID=1344418 RepID=A0A1D2VMM8_9ASCO|nr:putative nucleolar snoRNA-binding protein [Ascoidea rubescens DSM 1968]ODV62805.1 putative nucleolar snoRNA-binding protein [Ascoidea rubescens DSM 1968]
MGKISVSNNKNKNKLLHDPLYKDLTEDGLYRKRNKKIAKQKKNDNDNDNSEEYIDSVTSGKILQLAKEQQEEIEIEERKNRKSNSIRNDLDYASDEANEEEYNNGDFYDFGEEELEYSDVEQEEIEEVDGDDIALYDRYLNGNGPTFDGLNGSYNLADKILAEIAKKKERDEILASGKGPINAVEVPPIVIAAYSKLGQLLSTWKHGKLPKIFKRLPIEVNWEDLLYITQPESWTPNVCYEATKLFVSNLDAKGAQKFIEMVLLDRVRKDIEDSEQNKLNYHLYRSLKKSLYKPAGFFKGFLYPLVETGCTKREAIIVGSILSKVSVPPIHSATALTHLLKLDFSPTTTVFIRVLLEKKYALPYQTIDELVFYFMNFRLIQQTNKYDEDLNMRDDELEPDLKALKRKHPPLPVVWHKAFLAFAQRYKNDITEDQRDFLLETVRQRFHKDIGPEIRRELLASQPRMEAGLKEPEKEVQMIDVF